MPNYTFTFKKDEFFVDFKSTDKQVVERQFQLWVNDASSYNLAKNSNPAINTKQERSKKIEEVINKARESVKVSTDKTTEKSETKIEKQPETKSEVEQNLQKEPETKPEIEKLEIEKQKLETKEVEQDKEPEVFEKASSLLRTINSIQSDEIEKIKSEPAVTMPDFESILVDSMEKTGTEPLKSKDGKFLQLITLKNTQDKLNYFIITAYYLLEHAKLDRFTLKQINAKLMHNLGQVVDHTILQDAINMEFVELVPDLTGVSEASEYRLTEKGEDYYQNKI